MEFDVIQSNFTAGELSPKLKGRVDLEKYLAGLSVCENMIVLPSGGVSKRGGFHYVASVKDPAKTTTLIAFRYNDLYSYILEFGNNYIRVYFENEQVQSGGSPYEITTTYLEDEVEDIRVTQDATSLYIVHKNHAPAILTRTAHNNWTLSDMPFTFDYAYEDSWVVYTNIAASTWHEVCWSPKLELFCAVATTGTSQVSISEDGLSWTPQVASNNAAWRSICWSPEKELFVAVAWDGAGSRVMTSPDGVNWADQTPATVSEWASVCWSPEQNLFVAVSLSLFPAGVEVMTSPDGINWTSQTPAAANSWSSVCWSPEKGLFVAVSYTGVGDRVMTSPNGVNWTPQVSAADNNWQGVCWSGSLFVAIANSGVGNRVMTSPDGVNWTIQVSAADNAWRSVCWSSKLSLFFTVADTGTNKVMTSSDGIDWTAVTSVHDAAGMGACWSPDKQLFISVGDSVSTSSTDGVVLYTWVQIIDNNWRSVCWSSELSLYVAVASSGIGDRVATSPDGIDWTTRTSAADNDWQSVCWCLQLELFIAVADSGASSRMMISSDGITWELASEIVQTVDNEWRSLCWSPTLSLFCAVSSSGTGNRVMTSPDGEIWTPRAPAADNDWQSVCWSLTLTLFVAVSSSGTGNRVMTSPDGITWTIRVSAADNDWMSVCWSGSLFVAVAETGTGNRVMTSPDGITWTIRVSAADYAWKSICYASDISLFCAVAATVNTTNVMTSPDGLAWTIRTSGLNSKWESVCWHSTQLKFMAVASAGTIRGMYSSDGINWEGSEVGTWGYTGLSDPSSDPSENLYTAVSLYAVCEHDDMFVAIGEGFSGSSSYVVWSSYNGIDWVENNVIPNSWRAICTAPELPLVVALSITGTGNRITTSEDAISWKTWNFEFSNNDWQSVCWSPALQKVVAVSETGDNRVAVSLNGKAWGFFTAAAQNQWQSVCWSPERGLFVAVASSGAGNRVMTSLDGEVWNPHTSAKDNAWQSVCWSSELLLFCAVANTGTDRVMTSSDGFLWVPRTAAVDNDWQSVCWSEELERFVAVASSGIDDRIMVSSDGVTWETNENPVDNNWKEICWSSGLKKFVAVADTGTNDRVMYSITNYESWSSFDEYPSLIWFYEQRLFFASTIEKPNTIWGSKSADFFNLSLGKGLDNDALKLEVKAAYNFLWVSAGEEITIGGSNAEFTLSANALNEALTPSNVRPALRTKFGGTSLSPIRIDDSVIFIQQGARKFRRLVAASQVGGYANQYKASDLTILSSHITESGVAGAVNQTIVDSIIWAFCKDGSLIGLTYEPEHGIFGWHRHTIGGTDTKVKSLAVAKVIATGGNQVQDELWAVISHTVDGGTNKYIGYMREGLHDEDTIENSFFVDAGITKTGSGITTVDGLGYLEGEIVAVLGDGIEQTSKTVTGGEITLDSAVSKAQVGLSFTSIIETLPLEGGNPIGVSQGLIKRISAITLRLYRSLGVDVGDVLGNVDSYNFSSTDLFTGDTEAIPFAGAYDRQSRVRISSSHPLPLTLLSIMSQARTK